MQKKPRNQNYRGIGVLHTIGKYTIALRAMICQDNMSQTCRVTLPFHSINVQGVNFYSPPNVHWIAQWHKWITVVQGNQDGTEYMATFYKDNANYPAETISGETFDEVVEHAAQRVKDLHMGKPLKEFPPVEERDGREKSKREWRV